MCQVLACNDDFRYLLPNARETLKKARKAFREAGLSSRTVLKSTNQFEWFPWVGTRAVTTIALAAKVEGLKADAGRLSIKFGNIGEEKMWSFLEKLAGRSFKPLQLASELPVREQHKFDKWVDADLLDRANAESRIDLSSAEEAAAAALEESAR